MKILPFKRPEKVDYRVDLVEGIQMDGIPFVWTSNLSEKKLREVFQILLSERFFVHVSPDIEEKSDEGLSITITACDWIQEAELEYDEGICSITHLDEKVWVVHHTLEQYEAWIEELERQARVKEYHDSQIEKLEIKEQELLKAAEDLVKENELDKAEQVYLQWRKLRIDNPKVFRTKGRLEETLILFYRRYENPDKGIGFLDSLNDKEIRGSHGEFLYYYLAKQYYYTYNIAVVEQIYKAALTRYPKSGYLYKQLCIYLSSDKYHKMKVDVKLIDKAIKYCKEAVQKGLDDETKAGFVGRLRRLETQRSRLQK